MMSTKDKFSYYSEEQGGEGLQIARLPYGRDKIAMYIFLLDRRARSGSILFMGKIVNPLETKSP